MDLSDRTLLDRYLTERDEAAFSLLVRRYIGQVHATARRITGNDDLARDVAQNTFIRLAQRAALVPPRVLLTSWLHHTSRCLAVDLVRREARRKKRELDSTAVLLTSTSDAPSEPDWSALAPVVDELVDSLSAADREVLLLRYYRNESHAAVAARLGLTEGVARKRAFRAVEKLRVLLGRRGISTSTVALTTMLPAHAAPAAPPGLALSVAKATHGMTPLARNVFNSLLTSVNASQKLALAGSLLLLFAATGYTLVPTSSPLAAASSVPPPLAASTGRRAASRHARLVPSTKEERLARLREIAAIHDRLEQDMAMVAYLEALPPALLKETTWELAMMRFTVGVSDQPLALTLAVWTRADPQGALAFCSPPSQLGQWVEINPSDSEPHLMPDLSLQLSTMALTEWAGYDPQAAWDWLRANPSSLHGYTWLKQVRVAQVVARTHPEDVIPLMGDLPINSQVSVLSGLCRDYLNTPEVTRRILRQATDEQVAGLIKSLRNQMPPALMAELAQDHPGAIPVEQLLSPQ